MSQYFPDLEYINIGGGLGIPYKGNQQAMDIENLYKKINDLFQEIVVNKNKKQVQIWVEPGRFLIAESGYLVCQVTALKDNQYNSFVGTDSGMHHLIRPAFYGSHHEIINCSNSGQSDQKEYTITGNVCESSDIFAKNRVINQIQEGDILAICNAGAYGFSMASNYNQRLKPIEIYLNEQGPVVIRRRETFEDLIKQQTGCFEA